MGSPKTKAKSSDRALEKGLPFLMALWCALLCGSLALYLLLSLLSFSPLDPDFYHFRTQGEVRNLGGTLGAYLGGWLFRSLGVLSYLVPFLLLSIGVTIMRKRKLFSWIVDLPSYLLLFFTGSTLLAYLFPKGELRSIPLGGALGTILSKELVRPFLGSLGFFILFPLFLVGVFGLIGPDSLRWFGKIPWRSLGRRERKDREPPPPTPEPSLPNFLRPSTPPPSPLPPPITPETLPPYTHLQPPPTSPEPPPPPTPPSTPPPSLPSHRIPLPPTSLLTPPREPKPHLDDRILKEEAIKLEEKIRQYGVEGKVVAVSPGPVVHIFEFQPAPGVKVSRIASLEDDLALAMESQAVRIVAPIPGRNVVGIEIPNRERETVYLRPLLESREFRDPRYRLPVALGKDVSGKPVIYDLTSMPHLLMAGATGSGKSVGINTIILSLLYRHTPETVRLYLIDPKRLELTPYQGIPHLEGHGVVTDHEQALALFKALVRKMEERYTLLEQARVRNIESYNEKNPRSPLPYLVCIVDELSDLMMVTRKAIEEPIARLAQMARAAGIHLVLATQRPSVDVITGLIKANFPSRIAFRVSSKADSRVILDSVGAETLLGRGDMLFKPPTTDIPIRVHGAYVSEEEVVKVVEYLKDSVKEGPDTPVLTTEELEEILDELRGEREGLSRDAEEINDELLEKAIEIGRTEGVISTSRLQRLLGIGYNRAARLMDALEARGMVGPQEAAGKPRKFITR